ncbi:ribokinase [Martelella lutilitoris]|uniref:Ribokinase n=1 Tax=Martelella lutilitoris TaxID=2583532 RepID=A0A7T7HHP5_9HYPH|nr:ribokinase [Martelella lutilitoris]QQM29379.1 ribokinase [Martelella lutilitoris]
MITVFGSINMDLISTTERLPEPGETVTGTSFSTAPGGKGANQALAARRAGSAVAMAGAVGSDEFAAPATALLAAAGVDLSFLKTTDGPTGTAMILVGGDGENVIVINAAANGTLTEKDALAAVERMSPGDLLMLQLEVPAPAIRAALEAARRKGVTSVLNTAPLTPEAAELGALADIVIANETEFERLVGAEELGSEGRIAMLKTHHDKTGQTMVITLGGDGVIAMHDDAFFRIDALKIDPVDTVGAGDTFCGYLASALEQGLSFEAAAHRASVAGALACLKPGAQPSIPTEDEVKARL